VRRPKNVVAAAANDNGANSDDEEDPDDDDGDDPQPTADPFNRWEIVIRRQVDAMYEPLCSRAGTGELRPIPLRCNGSRCSVYGTYFQRCVALDIDPQSIPLAVLEAYCPFPRRGRATPAERRRCLLYYWFAVDQFGAFGRQNRV
jgi:hypothetical protein